MCNLYCKQGNWVLINILDQVFSLPQSYVAVKEDVPIDLNKHSIFLCINFTHNIPEKPQSSKNTYFPIFNDFLLGKCRKEPIQIIGFESCKGVNSSRGHSVDQSPNYLIQRPSPGESMDVSTLHGAIAQTTCGIWHRLSSEAMGNTFPHSSQPCGLVWVSLVLAEY